MPNPDSDDLKRTAFLEMLTAMNLLGEGAEIGVYQGWHAKLILDNWAGKVLYAIDPFDRVEYDSRGEPANYAFARGQWDRIRNAAKKTLRPYGDRCELWLTDSVSASLAVPDKSLDWAYIDARHFYDGVREDIQVWLPKVKKGGVLAGHDYFNTLKPDLHAGVKQAVDEFFGDAVQVMDTGYIQTWYVLL